MSVNNPRDLTLTLLADLLYVERQLSFELIPELMKEVKAPALSGSLAGHLEQTKRHAEAVEEAFRALDAEPSSSHCEALASLAGAHTRRREDVVDDILADALVAVSAAQIERYEIGGYSALIALARAMDRGDLEDLLERNLSDEERALDELERAIGELTRSAVEA